MFIYILKINIDLYFIYYNKHSNKNNHPPFDIILSNIYQNINNKSFILFNYLSGKIKQYMCEDSDDYNKFRLKIWHIIEYLYYSHKMVYIKKYKCNKKHNKYITKYSGKHKIQSNEIFDRLYDVITYSDK